MTKRTTIHAALALLGDDGAVAFGVSTSALPIPEQLIDDGPPRFGDILKYYLACQPTSQPPLFRASVALNECDQIARVGLGLTETEAIAAAAHAGHRAFRRRERAQYEELQQVAVGIAAAIQGSCPACYSPECNDPECCNDQPGPSEPGFGDKKGVN